MTLRQDEPTSTDEAAQGSHTRKSANFSDLRIRIFTALIIAALAIGALFAGGTIFILFWLVAALAIFWEWETMIGGARRQWRVLIGVVFLSIATALAANFFLEEAALLILLAAGIVGFISQPGLRLWAGFGVLYAGALILAICGVRPLPLPAMFESPANLRAILWLFAVVWGTDVMAYFGGRLLGGPKLWPRVSAGKTWSGAIVGVVSGALMGLGVASVDPVAIPVASLPIFLCGLVGGTAAQIGDLLESAIKRRWGVKDSSNLLPGHGGVMDRLDGFWAAALFVFMLGVLRGMPVISEGLFQWR